MRDALRAVTQRVEKPQPAVRPGRSTAPLDWLTGLLSPRPQPMPEPDPNGVIEELGNGVALEMIRIPGGRFIMGSARRSENLYNDEGPQHEVRLREFLIGRYPVTQAQWKVVMGSNPSYFKGDRLPVENVSWDEARDFCRRLNEKLGLSGAAGYRLPSEAEWEYAARAGTTTEYAFGETISTDLVNFDGSQSPDRRKGRYRGKTVEVGSLGAPNAWGLYDMHGNVSEWCEDDFHGSYDAAPGDGRPWVDLVRASFRVNRGGGWYDPAVNCRSASRGYDAPGYRGFIIGFRLARSLR
jgi:formylglycine-generating enzyme required for sulfatase activity